MTSKTPLQLIVLIVANFLFATAALAIPCGDGSGIDGAAACRDGYSQVDSEGYLNGLGALQSEDKDPLATAGFFSLTEWELLSKIEESAGVVQEVVDRDGDIGLQVNATGSSTFGSGIGALTGAWSFNPDIWNTYESVLLVLKGGSGKIRWSAYLLNSGVSSGTWDFSNTYGNSLSHVSVYGADTSSPVPEPAAMLLFGAGLAGIAGMRARSRKK